jgi:hypothetical protein
MIFHFSGAQITLFRKKPKFSTPVQRSGTADTVPRKFLCMVSGH